MSAILIPKNQPPSEVNVVDPEPMDLDIRGVEEAARSLGLRTMSSDRLKASHTLGKAIKKIGALKLGRSLLYSASVHAQEGIDQCDTILSQTDDVGLKLAAIQAKRGFVADETEVAKAFIKSVEVDGSDDVQRTKLRPFDAGKAAGPVVIAQNAVVTTEKS